MHWLVGLVVPLAVSLNHCGPGDPSEGPAASRGASAPLTIAVGARPTDVAAGDLTGDGHTDLVTSNRDGRSLTVLRGDGRGGLTQATGSPIPVPFSPHLVAVADIDGDGDLDLAAAGHDTHEIALFRNRGKGTFGPPSTVAALTRGQPHNHGLVLADLDGDRRADIVTANQNDDSVSVLLNRGGGFVPARGSPFAVGGAPYLPAVGDLNGDRVPDVAVANSRSGDVSVLLGDGKGGLARAPGSPFRVAAFPNSVAMADIDGDGARDLLATHASASSLSVLLADGKGRFRSGRPLASPQRGWKIRAADLSGDRHLDLAMGAAGDVAVLLLGDGKGGFRSAAGSPRPVGGRGPWGSVLANVSGDGKLELVTANEESNDVSIISF